MTTKDMKTPYGLLRKGVEDLIGVYANVEDTYGFRGSLERLLTHADTIPTETPPTETNAAKIVAAEVVAAIAAGTRVVRASSSGDDPAPEVLIVVSGGFPRAPEGDPDWPSKNMERFRSDANRCDSQEGPMAPEDIFAGRLELTARERAFILDVLTEWYMGGGRTPEGVANRRTFIQELLGKFAALRLDQMVMPDGSSLVSVAGGAVVGSAVVSGDESES